ncbi:hypothetical protein SM124_00405 [Bacillus sp. 31A1R]|uniref:Uncharacterized protein n=1 Tax=Robertmurraya mangrovi TaxID=3098077 RepID=A0ABU5ISS3_9BACI|nr:hypothetical protein [Bacillus sp. 31A1R]MDZ5470195.1 hypothetical protein [Bacillus sp. 31A1R]
MAQPFISNHSPHTVSELKEEIKRLKENIQMLELEIQHIQKNCKHVFLEEQGFRKCMKCHKIDVYYY